jgi:hypothetical protein
LSREDTGLDSGYLPATGTGFAIYNIDAGGRMNDLATPILSLTPFFGLPERQLLGLGIIALTLIMVTLLMAWKLPRRREAKANEWGRPVEYSYLSSRGLSRGWAVGIHAPQIRRFLRRAPRTVAQKATAWRVTVLMKKWKAADRVSVPSRLVPTTSTTHRALSHRLGHNAPASLKRIPAN